MTATSGRSIAIAAREFWVLTITKIQFSSAVSEEDASDEIVGPQDAPFEPLGSMRSTSDHGVAEDRTRRAGPTCISPATSFSSAARSAATTRSCTATHPGYARSFGDVGPRRQCFRGKGL